MRADRPLPPYACPARRGLQRRRRGIERGSSDLASRTEEGSARAGRQHPAEHGAATSSFHSANKCNTGLILRSGAQGTHLSQACKLYGFVSAGSGAVKLSTLDHTNRFRVIVAPWARAESAFSFAVPFVVLVRASLL